jgi:hypothetical protein
MTMWHIAILAQAAQDFELPAQGPVFYFPLSQN